MSRIDERMAMLEGEMDNLRTRIAELEAENKELREKANRTTVYQPTQPSDVVGCLKCGINPKGAWGYCCPDHLCPMGLGPISCMAWGTVYNK